MTSAPTTIPGGWQALRLGDVADVQTGGTPSRSEPAYWGGDVPWMASGEINQRRVTSTAESITKTGLKNSSARVFPAGTVMVAMNGQGATRGKAGVLGIEAACNQSLAAVSGCSSDNQFLFHVLDSSYERLRNLTGDGRNGLNLTLLRQLRIFLPPLAEQRAIAAVLDSIDEAIERTDEVIAATGRLRDSLLHELLTRGLPGRHSEWREVPGLGTIPASWEVVRLGDVAEVQTGRAVNRKAARSGNVQVPYLSVANVKDGYLDLQVVKTMRVSHDEIERYAVRAGDVLFTEGGDADKLGRGTVWRGELDPCLHQNHVFVARPDLGVLLPTFLSAFAVSDRGRRYFLGAAKQTTNLASVNSTQLKGMRMPLPTLTEQRAIAATLDSVDAAIEGARAERDALQSMKLSAADALLTGRVRISNAAEPDAPKATNVLESRMNRSEVLQTLRAHQARLAEQFGVAGLTLFGSVARDQATDASDIDILAEFESAPSWREYFGAQAYLEGVLGRPVDLMTAGEVRPEIRPYVERDAINV